jgi:hypothetical protein
LPAPGESFDWDEVAGVQETLDSIAGILKRAAPRPRTAVRNAYDAAQVWMWRAAIGQAASEGMPAPAGTDWRSLIAEGAANAKRLGHIAEIVDGDFPVSGKPFHTLSVEEYRAVTGPLSCRYWALLWLCGLTEDWATAERIARGELPPPAQTLGASTEEAAYRALSLGCLLKRFMMERMYRSGDAGSRERSEALTLYKSLLHQLAQDDIERALSPNEHDLVFRPLGLWTQPEFIDVSWRSEPLGCLLWALSFVDEIPPSDVPFDELPAVRMAIMHTTTREFLARARLRHPSEIAAAGSAAKLWLWRVELAILKRPSADPRFAEEWSSFRKSLDRALGMGIFPPLIEGDLQAFGRPVGALDDEQRMRLYSCTRERCLAFDWLQGDIADWDMAR